jgi:Uma2 family endonuclease
MTTTTRVGMPLDAFMEEHARQPFELINGEKRLTLPTVFDHGLIMRLFFRVLDAHVLAQKLGEVLFETTFILPESYSPTWVTGSRTPDLSFYAGNRIARYMAENPNHGDQPLPLVPDLVVEIISPTDKIFEVDEKVDAYLADGVRLIWLVNPKRRRVDVYSAGSTRPQLVERDDVLDGGDVLPGFTLPLAQVFAEL